MFAEDEVIAAMVGVVVLNYGTFDDVITCIASVKEKVKYPNYRIYVVDNDSPDDSFERLTEYYFADDDVVVISSQQNGGYSFGNNVGIKRAQCDGAQKILVLNPDVVFLNDVVSLLSDALANNPNVAIVGPRAIGPNGGDVGFIRKNYSVKFAIFDRKPLTGLARLFPQLDIYYRYPLDESRVFEGMVSGCCFMVETRLFFDLGLFDEEVFLYAEEYILGLKLHKRGLLSMYYPQARIIHNHGSSTKGTSSAFVNFHRYRSAFYTLVNYCEGKRWQKRLVRYQLVALYATRSLLDAGYRQRLPLLIRDLREIEDAQERLKSSQNN